MDLFGIALILFYLPYRVSLRLLVVVVYMFFSLFVRRVHMSYCTNWTRSNHSTDL